MARLLLALCLLWLTGCGGPELTRRESHVFGTRVEISVWGPAEAVAAPHIEAVLADFDRLQRKLHPWQPSELTRLNRAFAASSPAAIDLELRELLVEARAYEALSDGLFSPAIGEVVRLWGFHDDQFVARLPDPVALAAEVAAQPRLADLDVGETAVSSRNPAVKLDLGGFAKGWALDRAASYLRRHRIDNALINIGGNVLAMGRKGDQPWRVGLQHPRAAGAIASLSLNDGEAIGTSGDYQRYFELDGRRYHHLIDPRNGRPAPGIQAATVLAPKGPRAGTVSDVATKPLFIGGLNGARAMAERFGVAAMLVTADGSVYLDRAMQARLTWLIKPAHVYTLR
ncbi:FAD:protein FMN transferase [Chitinimonas lacunae]|uniref:FAD:protein FMN transferase n=1 Tax=Chitinimonas lacunae TaxID=1963018 RepID=A0ABV8MSX2_9NEIS